MGASVNLFQNSIVEKVNISVISPVYGEGGKGHEKIVNTAETRIWTQKPLYIACIFPNCLFA